MAYYPPHPHGYGYPPAFQHPTYPPAPTAYDQGYYNHAGYAPPPPSAYSVYPSGPPPSKKQKNNSGSAHYAQAAYPASISPPPPGPGYGYPPAYPPAFYPPARLSVPPPPPGWIPPPPPGWAGAVPPPPQYATGYPPAAYPPQGYPPTEHRSSQTPHGAHTQEQKPPAPFPRSKQWHNPKGPYGQGVRATSTAASATSQSSPKAVQTPREHSAGPTPPTERSASVSHAPRTFSRGSISHTRISSDDLHLDDDDYFCKEHEDINPALSLGEIVWKSGVPVGQAMPASWKKAKEWSDMLPLIQIEIKKEQSRSRYATTKENEEKECRPVRETEDWQKMKDDPVFADLSKGGKLISHQEAIANRAKSAQPTVDVDAEEGEIAGAFQYDFSTSEDYDVKFGSSPSGQHPPHFGTIMTSQPLIPNPADVPMPGIEDQDEPFLPLPQSDPQDDLIESIIRAAEAKATAAASVPIKRQLPGSTLTAQPVPQLKANIIPDLTLPQKPPRGLKRSRSRSKSPERKQMKTLPKPPEFEKDQTQEDILAALGVTGSPKPVYITPGPAYMAPPEGSAASKNKPHAPPPPPPPPPPPSRLDSIAEDADDGNPWGTAAGRAATPGSVTSQHTMVGSDFMEEDTEATPKASKSLKRQRDEQEEVKLAKLVPQDDATPRGNRQRAPRIHEAFSRRW